MQIELRNLATAGRRQWPLLVIALATLAAIVALGWFLAELAKSARNAYLEAIVPTMAGVLASAPIAYWAIRVGQDAEQASDSRRRTFALELLRLELENALAEMRGERAARPRPMLFPTLRSESWSRLTSGTDLRLLGESAFVDRLSNAYHRVAAMNDLERAWIDVGNEILVGDQVHSGDRIRDALERSDEHTIAALDDALAAIHEELDPHGPPYVDARVAQSQRR